MEFYLCQRCAFRCSVWRNHIRHTFEAHSSEPNFSLRCDVNGCTKTTSNYSTLMSHLSRQHREVDVESPSVHTLLISYPQDGGSTLELDQGTNEESVVEGEDSIVEAMVEVEAEDSIVEASHCQFQNRPIQSLERSAALFLLTLKEKYQLTQSAVNFALSQVKEMMFYDHQDKVETLQSILDNQTASPGIEFNLSESLQYKNPFANLETANLETEHLQTKYYKEHFGLVVGLIILILFILSIQQHVVLYRNLFQLSLVRRWYVEQEAS